MTKALYIVGAILAVIDLVQSRGASILGWGVLAVAVGLILATGGL